MINDLSRLDDHAELSIPGEAVAAGPDDELMTLEEAVARYYPNGPLTVPALRRAVRAGLLPVSPLSKRPYFVTRSALEALKTCRPITPEERQTRKRGGRLAEAKAKIVNAHLSAEDKLVTMLKLPLPRSARSRVVA